jgi:hypothetical protein
MKCVHGVARPSCRVSLGVLCHFLIRRVIDNVLAGVVPPLPYHMGVTRELTESLPAATTWGEVA